MNALRKEGLGDAESLGRLNIASASAALSDTAHVRKVRSIVASASHRNELTPSDVTLR
jgi:histidinol-phosphate aminotransferase